MAVGSDTFAGDVLRRLGVDNVLASSPERYPRDRGRRILPSGADLVVLPDEPYAFPPTTARRSSPGLRTALVSGRHLTWYGPSLVEARDVLEAQLAGAQR